MKYIFFFACILFFSGCVKDTKVTVVYKPPGCDSTRFNYTRDVSPIIGANCAFSGCHLNDSITYDYSRYSVVADRVRSGRFEDRIDLPLDDVQHMPKEAELSECDYFILKTWIRQGFPEN